MSLRLWRALSEEEGSGGGDNGGSVGFDQAIMGRRRAVCGNSG